jgi:hypothetical protein
MRVALLSATVLAVLTAHTVDARDASDDAVVTTAAVTDDTQDDLVVEVEQPVVDPRVACIEARESGGANVPNRGGSGAGGVMQYMESTFRAHAIEMGHPDWSRWTPWQARLVAAHDLAMGRRRQWTVGGCR